MVWRGLRGVVTKTVTRLRVGGGDDKVTVRVYTRVR